MDECGQGCERRLLDAVDKWPVAAKYPELAHRLPNGLKIGPYWREALGPRCT